MGLVGGESARPPTPARDPAGAPVAVMGAGAWGTCLALLLFEKGYRVRLWVRRDEQRDAFARDGENQRYLPGVPVPGDLPLTTDLGAALRDAGTVVFTVPSQRMRAIARSAAPHIGPQTLLVSAVKGIEEETLRRMSEVLADEIPGADGERVAALAGPSHAEEVARRVPTVVVAASPSPAAAERARALFGTDAFRVYTNDDLLGVELAVSLKNVIAIAAGICDGLGFGDNTRGALLSRGLAEITRLGTAMGARERTFWGLAGLGDLVTTATSRHSRNRRVGEELGRGRRLAEILDDLVMVAEGVPTARCAVRLAEIHRVEMPITREVHEILFHGKDPRQALGELMRRLPKEEGA